jgi:hypothetical protein
VSVLEVRNPVARLSAADVPIAARVPDLSQAKVGLFWNKKVGGNVALEWLADSIAGEYGTTTTPFYSGFPSPRANIEAAAAGSTVVIGSTGDCGSCTSWLIHDLVEIEKLGVPTVALIAEEFETDAHESARVFGMPDLRIAVMPRTLTNLSPEQVVEIAERIRPTVVQALLAEAAAGAQPDSDELPSPEPAVFGYDGSDVWDASERFQADFLDRDLGDGFPLIPPTQTRVDAMLAGTSRQPEDVIAILEPAMGVATVEKIAINAVMAGCKPEHLPVLLAAVEAMSQPQFALRFVAMSTGPHTPLIMVNGPVAERIGMNSGRGALGPGKRSAVNTVIGRGLRLVMMNVGYAYVGKFDLDTIGTPRKYSMALAENEAENPWEPFHVEKGMRPQESAVTMFSVESEIECADMANYTPEGVLRTYSGAASTPGAAAVQYTYQEATIAPYENLVLLAPEHAKVVHDAGWSKDDVREFIYADSFQRAKFVLNCAKPDSFRDSRRWALEVGEDELIQAMESPACVNIAVVGGATGKGQFLPGIGAAVTRSVDAYLP